MPLRAVIGSEKDWVSRALHCPDGVVQIVCLPAWFWDALDVMEEEYDLELRVFIEDCFYEASRRQGDFAYAFVSVLEYAILAMHHFLIGKRLLGIANDNLQRHDPWMTFRKEFFG